MKYKIVEEFPHAIMEKGKSPVISIYIDTKIKKPDRLENHIYFKNLVREAQESIKHKEVRGFRDLFSLFKIMEDDALFWEGATEGMAILADDEECVVYKLPISVTNRAIVADSFYIKPILKSYQLNGRYHVLALKGDSYALYEANRHRIHQIHLDEKHSTIDGVLGDEKTVPHKSVGTPTGQVLHGHGSAKDEKKVDQLKFFRYADAFIQEQYSNRYKVPLILVGLDENQGEFRKLSKNQYLIKEGIIGDVDSMDEKTLYDKVQGVMEGIFKQQLKEWMEAFTEAHAKDLGSDDVVQIARAITDNRVAALYLEEDKFHPGRFDISHGSIVEGKSEDQYSGDIYDDMAEAVLSRGGEVIILEKGEMPTDRDIAAVYRF